MRDDKEEREDGENAKMERGVMVRTSFFHHPF